ncbi:hypothetical protein [Paraburkholderia phenoliruptrix]|uniref:hypothetical protein n=1 Tax=Paraburkholderia phenoliruptrix TaxID=252970 RepID=UPI0028617086|nr:hypothetical protein [Paraburkholderia phenoliruptrix]MDR6388422.1 hypothetical protein [Paraburkholderia phenoliruptrix]WMY07454.1 hypothetical protein P3F88_14430 [Paraburkholderia phenoliruptrix]
MNETRQRYAVGRWESLWASDPYLSHRVLIDLPAREVLAGEHRFRRQWHPMSVRDLECMQQELDETYADIFDAPQEYGFQVIEEPPPWAVRAWPWPRLLFLTDDDDCMRNGPPWA